MAKKSTDNLVNLAQIAEDFGCSDRHVQRFVHVGMPKAGRGKYDRIRCLLWYIQKLKQDLEEASDTGNLEFEQTRVQRVTADIKEMEAARMRGELIPLEIYRREVATHFVVVKKNILSLAAKVAPQLEGLSRLQIKARLHEKHREILNTLATEQESTDANSDTGSTGKRKRTKMPDTVPAKHRTKNRTAPSKSRTTRTTGTASGSKPKRLGRIKSGSKKRNK